MQLTDEVLVTVYADGSSDSGVVSTWMVHGYVGLGSDGRLYLRWRHPDREEFRGPFANLDDAHTSAFNMAKERDWHLQNGLP